MNAIKIGNDRYCLLFFDDDIGKSSKSWELASKYNIWNSIKYLKKQQTEWRCYKY